MLKKLWKQMRWSLRTQIIAALFAGYALLLWTWKEPWVYAGKLERSSLRWNPVSPDRTRTVGMEIDRGPNHVVDNRMGDYHPILSLIVMDGFTNPRFVDDDTIALTARTPRESLAEDYFEYAIFKRRFPEWWWGHFYRPEVWLLPLWLGLIVWTIRKDRAVPK